jgi:hypothetical protein
MMRIGLDRLTVWIGSMGLVPRSASGRNQSLLVALMVRLVVVVVVAGGWSPTAPLWPRASC